MIVCLVKNSINEISYLDAFLNTASELKNTFSDIMGGFPTTFSVKFFIIFNELSVK